MNEKIEEVPAGAIEVPDPLLAKVNAAMRLAGSTATWMRAPDDLAEYEPLKGHKVAMVDDSKPVLENFAPILAVATDGNFTPIRHQGQSLQELAEAVRASGAEYVLVDYSLADDLKGDALVRLLNSGANPPRMIGFSSERTAMALFRQAGAVGAVDKMAEDTEPTVVKIADLVKSLGGQV